MFSSVRWLGHDPSFLNCRLDSSTGLRVFGSCPRRSGRVKTRKNKNPLLHPSNFYPSGVGEAYWYAPDGVSYNDFCISALHKYDTYSPIYSFSYLNSELDFFYWYLSPFHHSVQTEPYIIPVREAFYSRPLTGADAEPLWRNKCADKRIALLSGDLVIAESLFSGALDFEELWSEMFFVCSVMHKEEPLPDSKHTARGLGIRSTIEHILEICFLSKLFDKFKSLNATNSHFPWVYGADISSSANILYDRLTDECVVSDLSSQDKCHYPYDFRFYHDLLYELLGLVNYPKHIQNLFRSLIEHACVSLFRTDWGRVYVKFSGLISGDLITLFCNCLHHIRLYVRYLLSKGFNFDEIKVYLSRLICLGDDAGRKKMLDELDFHQYLNSIGIHMESSAPIPKTQATFIGHKFILREFDFEGNQLMFPYATLAPATYDKMITNSDRTARKDTVQQTYEHLVGQARAASADDEMRPKLLNYSNNLAKRYPFIVTQPMTSSDLNRGHGLSLAFRKVGHFN